MLITVFVKVFINTVKIALVKILLKTGTLLSEVLMKNHLETIELCLPHHSSLNDQIFNYDWDDEYDDGCFGICEFHNVKKRIVMMIFDGGGNCCAQAKFLLKSDQMLIKEVEMEKLLAC